MTSGNVAKSYQCGGVGCILAEIGGNGGDQIRLVDGVEDFKYAGYFENAMLRRRLRRHSQRDFIEAELGAGELTIISSRIGPRLAIERPRIWLAAERFRRPTLPVEGARQCNRIAYALGNPGKMRQRRTRLMKKSQRDPSSREMPVGASILIFRNRSRIYHLIGEAGIAEVEQFTSDKPTLHPPLIHVAKSRGLARYGQQ